MPLPQRTPPITRRYDAGRMRSARANAYPLGAAVTVAALDLDPHPIHERLRAREPVSWLPVLGAWLVTRRDLVLDAMRDPAALTVDDPRFSTGRVVGPSMLSLDGAEHRRHRDPFARPFRLGASRERFGEFTVATVDSLIDGIAGAPEADLQATLARPLAVSVMARALGLDPSTNEDMLSWYRTIVQAVTDVAAGEPVSAEGSAAFASLKRSIEPALDGAPDRSLLAAAAHDAHGLSRDEIISNAAVLLFGGIETTEGMIANLLVHVLGTPGQPGLLRARPELVADAIEESLRLEPAAAVIDRYATRDLELAGAQIGAGDLVTLSLAAANRDPAVFAAPHRFEIGRPNAKLQLSFAQGPHVCLGMHVARIEARTVLERVLARFPEIRLRPGPGSAPRGLVFRKPVHVHVQLLEAR